MQALYTQKSMASTARWEASPCAGIPVQPESMCAYKWSQERKQTKHLALIHWRIQDFNYGGTDLIGIIQILDPPVD